jgi:UDP-glucose 4-epimerase
MHELCGKKVLITGGAGLVGSHIADECVKEGAEVICYDSLVRGKPEHLDWASKHGKVTLIKGDIEDRDLIRRSMQGCDYVFHQAAMWLRACQKEPRRAIEVNVIGTFNVLEACVLAGVKKIVAASSSSVYGDGLYLPTDENHPYNNDLFYGMTKVAGEQLYRCFYKEHKLDYVGMRYLNCYGPRQPLDSAYLDVIMHFLNRIDQGLAPVIHGDGSQTVDLIYVEDVARLNVTALKSDVTNECFNGATGKETSLRQLAEMLCKLAGRSDLKPVYEQRDNRLVSRRCGCPKKAKAMLGFEPRISVEEGMRRVISWRQSLGKRQTLAA